MKTHDLKLNIEFCDAVLSGEKAFEVRKNDRGFQTGDLIRFIPTDGTSYHSLDGTIREHAKHEISGHTYKITYILNGWGIKNGYVVLGIKEYRQTEEVKHGKWKFHEKTKLVPVNKVGIKEEYTNGHDCTIVDDKNVNQKIMIIKKRITLKIPICSVCGWCGYDEYNATPYCPNCGARMESDNNA